MNDIEKIRSLAKAVQDATTKQEKSIAISDLHDSLNSQVVLDILDRLKAAEKSDAESIAMYRKARDERDQFKAAYNEWCEKTEWVQEGLNNGAISPKYLGWHRADVTTDLLKVVEKERDALRAKIEVMEQQTPVARLLSWAGKDPYNKNRVIARTYDELKKNAYPEWEEGSPLYLSHVAQPAPSVPDGWRGVIARAIESIGAGALQENANTERQHVEPYLDGIYDELEALEQRSK